MYIQSNGFALLALCTSILHGLVIDAAEEDFRIVMKRTERKETIIKGRINNFFAYAYDGTSNDQITDGGSDMYDAGNKIEIWVDNEKTEQIKYDTFYEKEGAFEFLSAKTWPFVALMHIENSEGLAQSFNIRVTSNAGADGNGYLVFYHGNVIVDKLTVNYTVTQVYGTTDPTICEVYFAIFQNEEESAFLKVSNASTTTDLLNTTVSLKNYPRQAWLVYTLLSRSAGEVISKPEVEYIIHLLVEAILGGTEREYTMIEKAMGNIERQNEQIRENITNFFTYTYDLSATNDMINDGGSDMYDGGNKVELWVDNEKPTLITYNQFYGISGVFDFFSSTHFWPFTALMYIDNTKGSSESFSIRVSGDIGADGHGSSVSYEDSFNLDNLAVNYAVTQVHGAGNDPTICEAYFAIHSNVADEAFFKVTRNSVGTVTLNTTVSLSNKPKQAWLGYTLLSRKNGVIILKNEVEQSVRSLARAITEISLPVTNILKMQKCSKAPFTVQWQKTQHSLVPMYTLQIRDSTSDETTNTSVQFLIFKSPIITMTEIHSASSHICVTITTMSTLDKTVVIEQRVGWVKGKLTAYTTATHEDQNGEKSYRIGFLDVF